MLLFAPMPQTDTDFDTFWRAYPKKVGKLEAQRAWHKATRTGATVGTVLTALAWQKASDQWRRGYIPNPSTYLNQGRWMDEAPEDLSQLPASVSGPCPGCGASEPCADVKVCNANWLAREKARGA